MEKADSTAQVAQTARGRRSRRLTEAQRERLEKFRRDQRSWSWPMVLLSMGPRPDRPFGLGTLLRAAAGGAISEKNHHFLVRWLDAAMPAQPLPQDGKSRAAADNTQESEETPEIAPQEQIDKTRRGSR
jgi:hypothetical protein